MLHLNIENQITFNTLELKKGEIYEIIGNEIITLVTGKIKESTEQILKTFESSCYYKGNKLEALENSFLTIVIIKDKNIILNKVNIDEVFGSFCRKTWKQLKQLWDVEGFEKIDLYRSNQLEYIYNNINYKFNFWFCGKNVDCLFHNKHNFIETHTNIAGDGFMQKSFDGTENGICETVGLMPGNSHRVFNMYSKNEENGDPKYPYHRWLGGNTGNIWLVIEKY